MKATYVFAAIALSALSTVRASYSPHYESAYTAPGTGLTKSPTVTEVEAPGAPQHTDETPLIPVSQTSSTIGQTHPDGRQSPVPSSITLQPPVEVPTSNTCPGVVCSCACVPVPRTADLTPGSSDSLNTSPSNESEETPAIIGGAVSPSEETPLEDDNSASLGTTSVEGEGGQGGQGGVSSSAIPSFTASSAMGSFALTFVVGALII